MTKVSFPGLPARNESAILERRDASWLERTWKFLIGDGEGTERTFSTARLAEGLQDWVCEAGLPNFYFEKTTPEQVARHVRLILSAKALRECGEGAPVRFRFVGEDGSELRLYDPRRELEVEEDLEERWNRDPHVIHVSTYSLFEGRAGEELRLLLVDRRESPGRSGNPLPLWIDREAPVTVRQRTLLARDRCLAEGGLVAERTRKGGEHRLVLAFPRHLLNHFQSNLTRCLRRHSFRFRRKYLSFHGGENPVFVVTLYGSAPFPASLEREIISVGLYPSGPIGELVNAGALTPDEANFTHAACVFGAQFATARSEEITLLRRKLSHDSDARSVLDTLQRRLDVERFSEEELLERLLSRLDLLKEIFEEFEARFGRRDSSSEGGKTRRPKSGTPTFDVIDRRISAEVSSAHAAAAFRSALAFSRSVDRTNFFAEKRSAVAFRFKGSDLGLERRPVPHAVFLVTDRRSSAIHVRFSEIARGGMRLIRPRNAEQVDRARKGLFDEAYALAWTQHRKNKDIPEGGAKGVIVLRHPDPDGKATERARDAFRRTVDALLDLCLEGGAVRETLFLGPDENTADLMDWAAERARKRGYPFWRSFTTGKGAPLGGISHIDFGMTSQGVRAWVKCLLKEKGLDERRITKVQTGGPDGDLGSNEILLSRDRTICVIDGSGVAWDPDGLDRKELSRLARRRLAIVHFSRKALGKNGVFVGIDAKNLRLPDGTIVENGERFRDSFHLDPRLKADLFVPCGGRPSAVHVGNWRKLLDETGRPRFPLIVEAANLFFTAEARIHLEESGCLLVRDASANKGGVTSSSLEVLAALVLPEKIFATHVAVRGAVVSPVRKALIRDIQTVIRTNAEREFAWLWKRREEGPLSLLSDRLSDGFLRLQEEVLSSRSLLDDPAIQRAAMALRIPPSLSARVTPDAARRILPPAMRDALVARTLAREFIYEHDADFGPETWRRWLESWISSSRVRLSPPTRGRRGKPKG